MIVITSNTIAAGHVVYARDKVAVRGHQSGSPPPDIEIPEIDAAYLVALGRAQWREIAPGQTDRTERREKRRTERQEKRRTERRTERQKKTTE